MKYRDDKFGKRPVKLWREVHFVAAQSGNIIREDTEEQKVNER